MKHFAICTILILLTATTLTSCLKTKEESPIPVISFKEFSKIGNDSAIVSINFKDGDGDIGLEQSDTSPPYNPGSEYYNNFHLIYYYKGIDGKFRRFKFPTLTDSLSFSYRTPLITPKGKNKSLEGTIEVLLESPYYVPGETPPHSVIKFDIYMYDRALNKSNVVQTPEITVP